MVYEERLPRWNKWLLMSRVTIWQAVALSLNIEPEEVWREPLGIWHRIPTQPIKEGDEFNDRLEILRSQSISPKYFPESYLSRGTVGYEREIELDNFAWFALKVAKWQIPGELAGIASQPGTKMDLLLSEKAESHPEPATKGKTETDKGKCDSDLEEQSPADADNDKTLAALFDPVPVDVLEAMFPADGAWKNWAEKAKSNGLKVARVSRGKFNPYTAGMWFVTNGGKGWTICHCRGRLATNLPSRSLDYKYLLTGGLD